MYGLGTWLLSAVLLGAAILVAHAAMLSAVWRAERATALLRGLAFVPPLLPIVGWRVGLRFLPVVWAVLCVAYLILRAAR